SGLSLGSLAKGREPASQMPRHRSSVCSSRSQRAGSEGTLFSAICSALRFHTAKTLGLTGEPTISHACFASSPAHHDVSVKSCGLKGRSRGNRHLMRLETHELPAPRRYVHDPPRRSLGSP